MNQQTRNALWQLLESAIITALIAGLAALQPVLSGTGPIDWHQAALAFGYAALFSLAISLATYLKGSNIALSTAIATIVDALEQRYQAQQALHRAILPVEASSLPESPDGSMLGQEGPVAHPANPETALRDGEATAPRLPVVQPGQGA